ncbi:lytic transglycosylase domain-containing protein [Ruminococcus sp.]|uniref:lytic transglycosylase domain-containing protein n=1 Tax=Ruminococcus sp. TaxID=41978 RepID=UPI003890594A
MSRYETRHSRETKGHGAIGFLVTFVLILMIVVLVFFFASDHSYKGAKGKLYSFFYPQEYAQQVKKYAAEFGVEEPLIYAVMRTESGFRPEVESHAGAMGLMQMMPSTFDWLQERLEGRIVYQADALTDPDVSIRYGTYLLSILLNQYDNVRDTAVAAYNAGTSTVDGWLEDRACSPDGRTLTKIPYEETAQYVERVGKAYEVYKKLYY